MSIATTETRPGTLAALRESGWTSRTVKAEIRDNMVAALERGDALFPGIVGLDPEHEIYIGYIRFQGNSVPGVGEEKAQPFMFCRRRQLFIKKDEL